MDPTTETWLLGHEPRDTDYAGQPLTAGAERDPRFLLGVRSWASRHDAEVTAVINVGDDVTLHGLRICPDLDSVMYTLGGGSDPERGWGRANETWSVKAELAAYGAEPTWFGLGDKSIIFVLVHAVLWAVALNAHSGFRSVSNTLRMVGRNYGLGGMRFVFKILIPAAFPSILTGLKIGWAFAWRTLIAAELVFGASSGKGGLGWFIYESKNQLDIPSVFAGLFSVILIGLLVENLIFRNLEIATVHTDPTFAAVLENPEMQAVLALIPTTRNEAAGPASR